MSKKIIAIFIIVFSFSCKEEVATGYTINAEVKGGINGLRAYLKTPGERGRMITKDTAIIMNERFSFDGVAKEPSLQLLFIDSYKGQLPLVVENGIVNLNIDKDKLSNSTISGTKTNEILSKHTKEIATIEDKYIELSSKIMRNRSSLSKEETDKIRVEIDSNKEKIKDLSINFMKDNSTSHASLFVADMMFKNGFLDAETLLNSINSFDKTIKNTTLGLTLTAKINQRIQALNARDKTKVGSVAPNFTGLTPEDKPLALRDIKSKVIILDFWASWCGPCRRENPNVVKLYNEYHKKGLEIVGISLDKAGQKNRWTQAIEKDKLPWPHLSNLKGWREPIAQLYGVKSIPATYILDENYKIIAKNLRGKSLEAKIAQLLD